MNSKVLTFILILPLLATASFYLVGTSTPKAHLRAKFSYLIPGLVLALVVAALGALVLKFATSPAGSKESASSSKPSEPLPPLPKLTPHSPDLTRFEPTKLEVGLTLAGVTLVGGCFKLAYSLTTSSLKSLEVVHQGSNFDLGTPLVLATPRTLIGNCEKTQRIFNSSAQDLSPILGRKVGVFSPPGWCDTKTGQTGIYLGSTTGKVVIPAKPLQVILSSKTLQKEPWMQGCSLRPQIELVSSSSSDSTVSPPESPRLNESKVIIKDFCRSLGSSSSSSGTTPVQPLGLVGPATFQPVVLEEPPLSSRGILQDSTGGQPDQFEGLPSEAPGVEVQTENPPEDGQDAVSSTGSTAGSSISTFLNVISSLTGLSFQLDERKLSISFLGIYEGGIRF